MSGPPKTRALIVVRTYPTPAKRGVEVSCTAGITAAGEWVRIFPVPWRRMRPEQQFHKYDLIDAHLVRAEKDPRPESHKIRLDSIQIVRNVPTDHEWQARKDIIYPLKMDSLCAIKKRRDDYGSPTLGIFKPASIELVIEPAEEANWSEEQLAILRQRDLFEDEPPEELEKIPFDFRYRFRCNDSGCKGHALKCTDWEMSQSWRKWRTEYGPNWEAAFREKYERQMIEKFDTQFYVGTMHAYPGTWIIVGLFYPPKSKLSLFPDD